jgi:hypothetical protein
MSDGVKRYRADRNAEMYQIAYIDEELGKSEPDPILRDVWVADADYDALAARLEEAERMIAELVIGGYLDRCPEEKRRVTENFPHLFTEQSRAVLAKERT